MKVSGIEPQSIPVQSEGTSSPVTSPDSTRNEKLWKACQNFESLFMGYLIQSMERTLPEGSLSGSGMPDLMFNQVMGSALSEGGGIGLAELLYRDLQAKQPEPDADPKDGLSLVNYLTPGIGKESNDQTSSR